VILAAASGTNGTWISLVVSTILGGGFLGGLVAYRKLKPESDQIIVSSAKDVVLIQKGALDDLRRQMDDMESRFDRQSAAAATAIAECHAEREELRRERDTERSSNTELRIRIEALESEVAALQAAQPKGHP
jgi:chromosome segregation ATPase